MSRELTEQEKSWLVSGLKTMATGTHEAGARIRLGGGQLLGLAQPRNPSFYLAQVPGLRVIDEYKSEAEDIYWVKFHHPPQGASVGLVSSLTEDGRFLIILVDEKTRFIRELEIV